MDPKPLNPATDEPLLISFFAGDVYYEEAAARLAEDAERLGIDHLIVRADLPAPVQWVAACRHKVRFIAEMAQRHDRPLLWVDVDTRLLARPTWPGPGVDLGFFLRGFRDFRQFDPVAMPRLIQPSIVYFGRTAGARRFIADMQGRELTEPGVATDDHFFQEAWVAASPVPAVAIFPPHWVNVDEERHAGAVFEFGRSGQAGVFKGEVQQHEAELFTPARRKAVLLREAAECVRAKQIPDAQVLLRRARALDPQDVALAYRVARAHDRAGQREQALTVLREIGAKDADHLARFEVEQLMAQGRHEQAGVMASALLTSPGALPADVAWAGSKLMSIEMELRAQAMALSDSQRPALWWMESPYPGNFGDILNPYLVERLTGLPPRRVKKGDGALAIGSTIRLAKAGTQVWGAGSPRASDRLDPRAQYLAVRGPLTAEQVVRAGAPRPQVLGDPACLLPNVYQPKTTGRRWRLGVVLHHAHRGCAAVAPGVLNIEILRAGYAGVEAFIDELCSCDHIVTSSLHGLIVSHAYGIPALWVDFGDDAHGQVPGDGMKFLDYLLSVGSTVNAPRCLQVGQCLGEDLVSDCELPPRQLDWQALLQAAPWPIKAGIGQRGPM